VHRCLLVELFGFFFLTVASAELLGGLKLADLLNAVDE
jgi:hypothetical protein